MTQLISIKWQCDQCNTKKCDFSQVGNGYDKMMSWIDEITDVFIAHSARREVGLLGG